MFHGYEGTHNQVPGMGTDLSRKLAIAQTRYMDKQKIAQFHLEDLARPQPFPPAQLNSKLALNFKDQN